MASGQRSHWLVESLKMFNICVIRPPEICVNLVFKHIHGASSYTMCRQFIPFVDFRVRERVLPDSQSTLIIY